MATNSHTQHGGVQRRLLQLLFLAFMASIVVFITGIQDGSSPDSSSFAFVADDDELEGRDLMDQIRPQRPTVKAAFRLESYAPGDVARLVISDRASRVSLEIRHVGPDVARVKRNDVMTGVLVARIGSIGRVGGRRIVPVRIGYWPTGLYFAQLTAPGGRVGYAPFVLRPERLGEHGIAVVLPTQTWQAYNRRDDDGDGVGDTWYENPRHLTVRLGRAFLDRGTPPHFKYYDLPFLHWLAHSGRAVDILSDRELNEVSGERLARAYSLIVFPGHHEYVTTHEYDSITRYRDLGGNLMFLSANNFFWRVDKRSGTITRVAQWRTLGRPEAALIGVQYFMNDAGEHRGPWIVRNREAHPWVFAGTDLRNGSPFSSGGIEADHVVPASPNSVQLVAEIPNLYGPGLTAQMTYYETRAGAKVFAAGAFTFAGAVNGAPGQVLGNLWEKLARA